MPRELAVFLVICAVLAAATLAARYVRLQFERGSLYAKVVANCASGKGFTIERTAVLCFAVETRGTP
jgi:hypothetical protein